MTTEEPAAQPAGTLHRALRMRHRVTLSIGGLVPLLRCRGSEIQASFGCGYESAGLLS